MVKKLQSSFSSIGVVGLGLIGGSFAKAFSISGMDVYGYDVSKETIEMASNSHYFKHVTDELETFLSYDLDLIYICLPMLVSLEFVKTLGKHGVTCAITDAGSVKASIVQIADEYGLNFCGGHPIRGKETSGFENADEDLYCGALHVLTPCEKTDKSLVEKLTVLHEMIQMNVEVMDAHKHDVTFSLISHLPHIAAFSMVETAISTGDSTLEYAGGGFRDFTRIAASDATMWADVFIDNKEQILASIATYERILNDWKTQIEQQDREKLYKHIKDISNIRRTL